MTDPARPTLSGSLTGVAGWTNAITFSADDEKLPRPARQAESRPGT